MPGLSENFSIIGHRGAAGEKLENSLSGFRHTLKLDISGIELDVREHSGELWVIHDSKLERVTDKPGLFGEQPDPTRIRLRNGEAIPTLKQVLDLYWGKMPVNIEIKSIDNLNLLLDLLSRYPTPGKAPGLPWIMITSFNHARLLDLKQQGCSWPLAPITTGIPVQTAFELEHIGPYSWHFNDEYLDFKLLTELREQGVPSFVFTVNDVERAHYLKRQGVAGIFTDIPSKMAQID
jgi:glycerophosphoryl diester phosphodiesterase